MEYSCRWSFYTKCKHIDSDLDSACVLFRYRSFDSDHNRDGSMYSSHVNCKYCCKSCPYGQCWFPTDDLSEWFSNISWFSRWYSHRRHMEYSCWRYVYP